MKKVTFGLLALSVVVIILILSCNSSKSIKTDWEGQKVDWVSVLIKLGNWEEMNLKGKIKRLIKNSYLVPKKSQQISKESKNKLYADTIFFDNNGSIKGGNIMSSFSSLIFIEDITLRSVLEDEWIFNPEDSLERNYFWYSSLNIRSGDTYKFISDGGMYEDMNSKTIYNYQTSINQVEINIFDSKDVLRQKNICKYNDENRIVSESLHYPNGSLKMKST